MPTHDLPQSLLPDRVARPAHAEAVVPALFRSADHAAPLLEVAAELLPLGNCPPFLDFFVNRSRLKPRFESRMFSVQGFVDFLLDEPRDRSLKLVSV
jgi:hypothetical protein